MRITTPLESWTMNNWMIINWNDKSNGRDLINGTILDGLSKTMNPPRVRIVWVQLSQTRHPLNTNYCLRQCGSVIQTATQN